MIHANTGKFLHLCSIKSIPECKMAWLNKNILRKLKLKLSVVNCQKKMGVFSQILIFLLLCFSIPRASTHNNVHQHMIFYHILSKLVPHHLLPHRGMQMGKIQRQLEKHLTNSLSCHTWGLCYFRQHQYRL